MHARNYLCTRTHKDKLMVCRNHYGEIEVYLQKPSCRAVRRSSSSDYVIYCKIYFRQQKGNNLRANSTGNEPAAGVETSVVDAKHIASLRNGSQTDKIKRFRYKNLTDGQHTYIYIYLGEILCIHYASYLFWLLSLLSCSQILQSN